MKYAVIKQTSIVIRLLPGFLFIALILFPKSGLAQQALSPISIEVEISPMQATVGDLITYTIRVRHDSNIEPSPPQFLPPEGLEAVDQGTRELPHKKSQSQQEFWFRLRADRVGSYEFPALPIPFLVSKEDDPNKKTPGQAPSPKAKLEIQSVLNLQGEPKDIRDIKPLENINRNWWPIVLAVLTAILVALGIYWFIKSRKIKSVDSPVTQEALSPQEAALQDLEFLKAKGLVEKGLLREYYFELSEIFRRYLGAKFNFPALDWTTEEIKHFLPRSPFLNKEENEKMVFILENTDLVKFAKAQVTGEETMTEKIIQFIQETSRPTQSKVLSETVGNNTGTGS